MIRGRYGRAAERADGERSGRAGAGGNGRPFGSVRWLLYGPVVVAAAYRGRGIARGLFTTALEAASGRAEVMVAFIEMTNRASWTVHVDGLGMTPLGEFDLDGRAYGVVGAACPAA
ncbi:GNAT family N-acetyltransferase [Streptomyces sp. NPDC099050]|uniref:GNAT family N-acetyltransferase n=1 Tax=Streptomyces sp. NPDC099050 TaxID=3366100 RepID=UPI0037FEE9F8